MIGNKKVQVLTKNVDTHQKYRYTTVKCEVICRYVPTTMVVD